jgi:hypothetical protein
MKYLLSVIQPTDGTPPEPEALERVMRDLEVINGEMKAAGAWVFAGGLNSPSTATVLQLKDDEVQMTDGPFTEGKEYLGGISIIEASDLDEALGWARRLARAIGLPLELRPFYDEH